jgi:hypothetical protein
MFMMEISVYESQYIRLLHIQHHLLQKDKLVDVGSIRTFFDLEDPNRVKKDESLVTRCMPIHFSSLLTNGFMICFDLFASFNLKKLHKSTVTMSCSSCAEEAFHPTSIRRYTIDPVIIHSFDI